MSSVLNFNNLKKDGYGAIDIVTDSFSVSVNKNIITKLSRMEREVGYLFNL